jgi:hypothetical protein
LKNIKPIQGYKAMALLGDAKIFDADLIRAARLAGLTAPPIRRSISNPVA